MPIKKIRGYFVAASANAANPITTIADQRLLCAIETCLDYAAFNSILCDYHDSEADKAWLALDATYDAPACGDESDVIIPTMQGYREALTSNQCHRPRTRTARPVAITLTFDNRWLGTNINDNSNGSGGGDAA